jgi:hypothetical protein
MPVFIGCAITRLTCIDFVGGQAAFAKLAAHAVSLSMRGQMKLAHLTKSFIGVRFAA